jgi:hypothetical protein
MLTIRPRSPEDSHRVPHRDMGDAELFGQVEFAGQLAGISPGFDARGDCVGDLLVGVPDAGAVYRPCRR